MFNMLEMSYVVKCILMNYMLNLLIVKSHPFCVYVASTVGNVQVLKIRSVRERTPHLCLGALIRNGMGLAFLSIPYVSL
jgi:hypothetical protein